MKRHRRRQSAVTLLELLLALALTGLVMILITTAIELNLRSLDSRRSDVERAQLARAVLRHIAADLKNAVLYEPIDVSGVPEIGFEGLEGGIDALLGDSMTDLFGSTDLGLGSTTANNLDIAGSLGPTSVPGLFGNQFELQVDISRLPRVDQYQQVFAGAAGAPADIPSDVKTVAYFIQFESADIGLAPPGAASEDAGGLTRREWDRAVTAWAARNGGLDASAGLGQILAPEVNHLEFRYFDGMQWNSEWDSEQMGGLPVAVEITIGIDPTYGLDPASTDFAKLEYAGIDLTEYTYRLVVRLPTARPAIPNDQSLEVWGL
jgi:type II secretory pathway component PulJ